MEAATLVFRRSGVRLRSLSGRHAELRLLISDLRALRAAQRALSAAQLRTAKQLLRWAQRNENIAVQETSHWLCELSVLHSDALTQFNAQLKALRYQFEMILESEERLDACREQLADCEARAAKHRRELKRASSGGGGGERCHVQAKLQTAERAAAASQQEVAERTRENEAGKCARLRQGLLAFSDACAQLAGCAALVAGAQRSCVSLLPELDPSQLHTTTYTGGRRCEEHVTRVRELLKLDSSYSPPPGQQRAAPAPPYRTSPERAAPPPPYRTSPERASAVRSPQHCCHCGAVRSPGWTDSSLSSNGGGDEFSPSAPVLPHTPGIYPRLSPDHAGGGVGGRYPSPGRAMAGLQLR